MFDVNVHLKEDWSLEFRAGGGCAELNRIEGLNDGQRSSNERVRRSRWWPGLEGILRRATRIGAIAGFG